MRLLAVIFIFVMAITKEKKVSILEKLSEKIKGAKSLVFVQFHGLSVADSSDMRRELRNEGVGYMVAKKTLIKRALEGAGIKGDLPELSGEIAIAFGDDPLAPAKGVYTFQKKTAEAVKIVGGIVDEEYADQSKMLALATVPSRETLYGQFVFMANWPIKSFVVALNQIAEKKEA